MVVGRGCGTNKHVSFTRGSEVCAKGNIRGYVLAPINMASQADACRKVSDGSLLFDRQKDQKEDPGTRYRVAGSGLAR